MVMECLKECEWLESVQSAKKTLLVQDGRRKVHYSLPDEVEMAEEYDVKSNRLLTRKWRYKNKLGGEGSWEFEVGEELLRRKNEGDLVESNSNPIFCRTDTQNEFQWRLRNIPYPLETYSVSVEDDSSTLVLRTSNKKYYKRFEVPDMKRLGLKLSLSAIKLSHANNTLLINYTKPEQVLHFEKRLRDIISKLKPFDEADSDCKTS